MIRRLILPAILILITCCLFSCTTPPPTFDSIPTVEPSPSAVSEPELNPSSRPSDTHEPELSPETAQTETPEIPAQPPDETQKLPLEGVTIGLDPGHQSKANYDEEPVAPNSSEKKAKVSSGTQGVYTKVYEYTVNLNVALLLRDLLEANGANVVMTRTSNDVDISNSARAKMLNDANVDLAVRIHCNGTSNSKTNGAFILVPSGKYTKDIQEVSHLAAQSILDAFIKETGAKDLGITPRDDQTGFNFSTVPICNIEMGHMSNKNEDILLTSSEYQEKCAQGIFNGILAYFE